MDNSTKITEGLAEINAVLKEVEDWSGNKDAHNLFFRGQADCNWKLIPKVRREDYKSHPEYDYIQAFVAENDINDLNGDYLRILEKAQHYGIATRLLDWSKNLLVALYFACKRGESSDGKVFVLDYVAYQEYMKTKSTTSSTTSVFSKIISVEVNNRAKGIMEQSCEGVLCYPIIYKPWYHEERIKVQSNYFMIWCRSREPFENIISDDENKILKEITIDKNKKSAILCALSAALGINERVLFPTLDNIGEQANILVKNS
jgi:hypothetical protein